MRREARAVRFKDGMSAIGGSSNGRWGRSDLLRRATEEGVIKVHTQGQAGDGKRRVC